MDWLQILSLLICPLMMIFCMKGMMGGHKHHHDSHSMNDIDNKMIKLQAENDKLRKDIENLTILVKKES